MLLTTGFKRSLSVLVALTAIIACSPEVEQKVASDTKVVQQGNQQSPLKFKLGQDYEIVRDTASSTPQMSEHFSLYCIHCYRSEALFKQLKSALPNIPFSRSHVLFLPQKYPDAARNMTLAFAAAGELGIENEFVDKVFDYHFVDKSFLGQLNELKNVFVVLGKTGEEFIAAINDQKTLARVKAMDEQANADAVRFTPDLIISDKYRVKLSVLSEHENEEKRLIALVNYLLTNP